MRPADWPEIGPDLLDPPDDRHERRWIPRRRPALGVRATAVPTALFVGTGMALGPHGIGVLSPSVLAHAHAVGWVALAVIGVFVGLGLAGYRPAGTVTADLRGSSALAVITAAALAGALSALVGASPPPLPGVGTWTALLIGLCLSVSAAVQPGSGDSLALRRASQLAHFDDVPLMVGGAVVVAVLAADAAALRVAATVVAGAAIGAAGCLLFEQADESERGLFVAGAVLLLAGVGAYLGTSPLLSGAVAAIVWVRTPGAADRITARDLRTLQHPLVALLLVMAGAQVTWTPAVLWLAAGALVARLAAKLLASLVVARRAGLPPALLAAVLLPPGVMGIALAVNATLLLGDSRGWIVSTVTLATVASEVLAAFLPVSDETTGPEAPP